MTGIVLPHVQPGNDFTVLNRVHQPSGFEAAGFNDAQIDEICAFISALYVELLSHCPKELAENAPRILQTYCLAGTQFKDAATFVGDGETVVRGNDGEPLGFSPPRLKGIGLNIRPGESLKKKESPTYHELVHVLQRFVAHGYLNPILEAFVARIEKDRYRDREADFAEFGRQPLICTTGFCGEGNERVIYSPAIKDAFYHDSYFACDSISTENLWRICTLLTDKSLTSGIMANRAAVQNVLQEVLQEEADGVLKHPSFQSIKQGDHRVVHCGKDREEVAAKINSFRIDSQLEQRITNFKNTIHVCADIPQTGGISILYEFEGEQHSVDIQETLSPRTIIRKSHVAAALIRKYGAPENSKVLAIDIQGVGRIPFH